MTVFTALPVVGDAEAGMSTVWSAVPYVSGPKWLEMPILTVGMLGLQIVWSVEMSYGEDSHTDLGKMHGLYTWSSFPVSTVLGTIQVSHVYRLYCWPPLWFDCSASHR